MARTQQAAIDGNLSIMVGGDPGALKEVEKILLCMGPDITHCGSTGCGQIAKILNNMVVFKTVSRWPKLSPLVNKPAWMAGNYSIL